MTTVAETPSGHFHAVRFYDSAASLCRIVAGFLADGLKTEQPALVIATPEHRAGIAAALRAQRLDPDALQAAGDLLLLDAEETLALFMVEGRPDAAKFATVADEFLERACRGRKDCTIRAYGEMVDVLWKRGHAVAAVRLEMFWNRLAESKDFSLLCGYAMGNFYKGSQKTDICSHHSHVVDDNGVLQPAPAVN